MRHLLSWAGVSASTESNLGDRSWWQVVSAVSDASLQPIC